MQWRNDKVMALQQTNIGCYPARVKRFCPAGTDILMCVARREVSRNRAHLKVLGAEEEGIELSHASGYSSRTETIMNVFATDHPMTMNEPCFDRQRHPWLSFVTDVLVSALLLFPFFYGFVLYCALADD